MKESTTPKPSVAADGAHILRLCERMRRLLPPREWGVTQGQVNRFHELIDELEEVAWAGR